MTTKKLLEKKLKGEGTISLINQYPEKKHTICIIALTDINKNIKIELTGKQRDNAIDYLSCCK